MTRLNSRIERLERRTAPESPRIDRIIISPAGGDSLAAFVMERTDSGTWHHRPITENEADTHTPKEGQHHA